MPRKQTRAIAEPTEIQTQSEEMNDTQAAGISEGENSPQTDSENTDSQRIHDEDGVNADGSEAISQTDPESSVNSPQNAIPGSEGTENSDVLQTDSEINADFEDSDPGNMSSHEKNEESKTEKTGKAENAEGGTTVSQSDKSNTDSLENTDDAARIIKKASTTIKRAGRTPVIAIDERLVAQTDEEKLGFTYAALDAYIRDGVEPDAATKARIDRLYKLNRFKVRFMDVFPYRPE